MSENIEFGQLLSVNHSVVRSTDHNPAMTLSAMSMLRARLRTGHPCGFTSVENAKRMRTQGGGLLAALLHRRPSHS